jgi:hypothetical protein
MRCEQRRVEVDLLIVGRGGQLGRPLLVDRLHLGAVDRFDVITPNSASSAVEVAAGVLERAIVLAKVGAAGSVAITAISAS